MPIDDDTAGESCCDCYASRCISDCLIISFCCPCRWCCGIPTTNAEDYRWEVYPSEFSKQERMVVTSLHERARARKEARMMALMGSGGGGGVGGGGGGGGRSVASGTSQRSSRQYDHWQQHGGGGGRGAVQTESIPRRQRSGGSRGSRGGGKGDGGSRGGGGNSRRVQRRRSSGTISTQGSAGTSTAPSVASRTLADLDDPIMSSRDATDLVTPSIDDSDMPNDPVMSERSEYESQISASACSAFQG